jgi:2-haloacid dehalogenase
MRRPAAMRPTADAETFRRPNRRTLLDGSNEEYAMLNRRMFLAIGAAGLAMRVSATSAAGPSFDSTRIKAVAFDAFPILDPQPVFRACETAFPGHGTDLANAWRSRQFEYQWLRALGGQYENFWETTRSALEFAARAVMLELTADTRDALMREYLALKAWPEVSQALARLKRSGRQLAFLSNATTQILEAGVRNSGLDGIFNQVISTDRVKSFKPDPRAYQLGVDLLGLRKEEILFVAFAGWDVAGAKWFGYPTFWANRQKAPVEQLGATPDGVGASLDDLTAFMEGHAVGGR